MNHTFKLISASLCSALLSACGGGGDIGPIVDPRIATLETFSAGAVVLPLDIVSLQTTAMVNLATAVLRGETTNSCLSGSTRNVTELAQGRAQVTVVGNACTAADPILVQHKFDPFNGSYTVAYTGLTQQSGAIPTQTVSVSSLPFGAVTLSAQYTLQSESRPNNVTATTVDIDTFTMQQGNTTFDLRDADAAYVRSGTSNEIAFSQYSYASFSVTTNGNGFKTSAALGSLPGSSLVVDTSHANGRKIRVVSGRILQQYVSPTPFILNADTTIDNQRVKIQSTLGTSDLSYSDFTSRISY